MKSEKVLNDLYEYLVLFGSREPSCWKTQLETIRYCLDVDLAERFKQDKEKEKQDER